MEEKLLYEDEKYKEYILVIGKVSIKDSVIYLPEETKQAIREIRRNNKNCLLDDNRWAYRKIIWGTGLEFTTWDDSYNIDDDEDDPFALREMFPTYECTYFNSSIKVDDGMAERFLDVNEEDRDKETELILCYPKRLTESNDEDYEEYYIINLKSYGWRHRPVPYEQLIKEAIDEGRLTDMHLNEELYYKILSGKKVYELRLNDEKRQKLMADDYIRFTKVRDESGDCFCARVRDIKHFDSFEKMYEAATEDEEYFTLQKCGSSKNTSCNEFIRRMRKFYPEDKEKKFGVIAIGLEVVSSTETERRIMESISFASKRRDITASLHFSKWNDVNSIIYKALCTAELAHRGVKRKMSDNDFICHPYEVASIVYDIIYRHEFFPYRVLNRVIAAAALHDVVEDTSITLDEIEEVFGDYISNLVAEESENKRRDKKAETTWKIRKEEFLNKLEKGSEYGKLIALADKLSNMRDMVVDNEELGEELWNRFNNKKKEDHAWYYKKVVEIIGGGLLGRDFEEEDREPICEMKEYKELRELVEKVFG